MKHKRSQSTLSRRHLLGGVSTAAVAASLPGRASAVRSAGSGQDVFVQIFMRGGLDGLSTLVPHGDADYYAARPNLAVPAPGQPNGALDLDGFFGLAPSAAPLLTPYSSGHLAFVHAVGSTDPTRSHFEAYARMEYGTPNMPASTIRTGWLARYLSQMGGSSAGILRAVSAGHLIPKTLRGAERTQAITDFGSYTFPGNPATVVDRVVKLRGMYGVAPAPLGPMAMNTFDSLELLGGVEFDNYLPANGAQYPNTIFGNRMRDIAALIKADIGVETFSIDFGSFDHHIEQGPVDGRLAAMLDELTRTIEAFYLDLQSWMNQISCVCMSEFGREVEENGSLGSDHGHGGLMMLMGGGIQGGQVFADWPGLAPSQRDHGDLAVTTDYRDVLGEILLQRLGATDLTAIFPGHSFTTHGVTL